MFDVGCFMAVVLVKAVGDMQQGVGYLLLTVQVKDPCDYNYSSARYYERDEKNFSFLKDLWEEF